MKSFVCIIAAIVAVFFISGCETVPKKFREEVSGMKSRLENLESKVEGVEAKQQEVERSAGEQAQALEELRIAKDRESMAKSNVSVKPRDLTTRSRIKDIQRYLKNAGFYTGKINGVKTKRTRKAIREFQKANGLRADGVVGPKTWELLSKYASGGAGSNEEGATK